MKRNILKIAFVGMVALASTGILAAETVSENTIVNYHGTKTENFKVYGNCGMCEKTIEGSLKDIEGIEASDWDKDTKVMKVTYHPEKISLDQIKQKIAAVGYDTDDFKASDKSYTGLAGCCQYKRPEAK